MNEEKIQGIWAEVILRVKGYEEVDAAQAEAFFSRLHLQAFAEGFAMFTADNAIIKTWVEKQYLLLIQRAFKDIYGTDFKVIIEVDEAGAARTLKESKPTETSGSNEREADYPPVSRQPASPSEVSEAAPQTGNANMGVKNPSGASGAFSKMTFENYIVGDSNHMAYSMALSVAEVPGQADLNPLFIYGKSGVGKTHLLVAIKNYLDHASETGSGPLLKTVYVDAAEFINDYADASADHTRDKNSFRSFKERYEEADVLLIDDVQTFQGKKETLKIIFELFNKLTSRGKQVVMSADIAPRNIDIDERYKTRFNSGGTFDIQAPEVETKLSIINSTIDDQVALRKVNVDIPQEVRMYVADISSSNIRELKSAVTGLLQHLIVSGDTTITIDQAAKILENHFSNDIRRLTIADIQKEVESFYKVSHSELVGKGRRHTVAYARQVAMYLSRELMEETFGSIGKEFGGKDHSTVKYSVDLIAQKAREDKETQEEIDIIISQIRNR